MKNFKKHFVEDFSDSNKNKNSLQYFPKYENEREKLLNIIRKVNANLEVAICEMKLKMKLLYVKNIDPSVSKRLRFLRNIDKRIHQQSGMAYRKPDSQQTRADENNQESIQ